MNRLTVVVATLWTMLFALACGSSDAEPGAAERDKAKDAGEVGGEKTQNQTKADGGNETGGSGGAGSDAKDASVDAAEPVEADSCEELRCDAQQTCEERDGKARCVCKAGLVSRGGACVSPDAPVAADGEKCSADSDCENEHCVSGICCKQACDKAGVCQSGKGATCEDGQSCEYPAAQDGTACEADSCNGAGTCQSGACGCTAGGEGACAGNPCGEGRGACTPAADGTYSCACEPGMREVQGQCVCDMQGTFALRYAPSIAWSGIEGIEDGSGQGYSWAVLRQTYDAQGELSFEQITCGETVLDLCGAGVRIAGIPAEAYSQYVPVAVWGKPGSPSTTVKLSLPAPVPGSAFKTPRYARLNGISLADPLGAWPESREDIEGSDAFAGSATNGARWVDSDQDSAYGQTTYAVGPGGETPGGELAPMTAYAQTSMTCPRGNETAARLPYNYPPGLDGVTPRRIKRFSSANRTVSELDGTIQSCDEITGNVTGPTEGGARVDVRIGSCVRVDAESDSGEAACSNSVLSFLDATQVNNTFDAQTFIMKRVAEGTTCEQVRALTF
jgi:hypothetical protein